MTTIPLPPPEDGLSMESLVDAPSYDSARARSPSMPDAIRNVRAQSAANRANEPTDPEEPTP